MISDPEALAMAKRLRRDFGSYAEGIVERDIENSVGAGDHYGALRWDRVRRLLVDLPVRSRASSG